VLIAIPTPFTHPAELKNTLRQIDDVAFLATPSFIERGGLDYLTRFHDSVLGLTIEWTHADAAGWTPWLDTSQRVNPNTGAIEQRLYTKPGNTFSYPHAQSYIPKNIHNGVLIGGLKRIDTNASPNEITQQVNNLLARLRHLGHQPADMRQSIEGVIRKRQRTHAQPTPVEPSDTNPSPPTTCRTTP
jgi:hypothetical protein